MKRKESKIPLVLTMIVLGYFVFMAIGYVRRNKPAPIEQPVAVISQPPVVAAAKTQEISQPQTQQLPVQTAEQVPLAKSQSGEESPTSMSATDNSETVSLEGRTQNRKLAGLLQDTTVKR